MKINFLGKKIPKELKDDIKLAAKLTLSELGETKSNIELNIEFLSKEDMLALNERTRAIKSVTDVLSFPNLNIKAGEKIDFSNAENYILKNVFLGDMAICLERAGEQAREYGVSLESEVVKLVIHSVLHLMGYDHIKDQDFKIMNRLEKKISTKFSENKKVC